MIPDSLADPLRHQLAHARQLFDQDRAQNLPGVFMPFGLDTKYPNAGKQWPWFWLFPAAGLSTDPRTKIVRRHHEGDHVIQRAMKDAVTAAAITKPATPHTFSHSTAMHLLESGVDCSVIALWLGHETMVTTQIYLHASLEMKERALAKTQPPSSRMKRYRPPDALLAFLNSL